MPIFINAQERKKWLASQGCTFEAKKGGSGQLIVRLGDRKSELPMHGACQVLAIAKDEADPATDRVHVPAEVDVRAIRQGLKMSQAAFAETFGLFVRTVQGWAHGRAKPDLATRAYLRVIERRPDAVKEALAA